MAESLASTSTEDGEAAAETDRMPGKKTSYARQQKIVLFITLLGQFFVNACVSLPAPFLPKLVCIKHRLANLRARKLRQIWHGTNLWLIDKT